MLDGKRAEMRAIETEIIINSTPEKVWKVLMDLERYPEWNPFVTEISGVPRKGEILSVVIKTGKDSQMRFTPTVVEVEDHCKFAWLGSFIFRGLFDGRHEFRIKKIGEKMTRFIHRESFRGVLTPVFMWAIEANTRRGFQEMNEALKRRVEQG